MRSYFSSGPCAKYLGWNLNSLEKNYLHRSHRSKFGREKINEIIQRQKKILNLPEDYVLAMVPGSATGAIEMALWCFLGSRGVDVHVMDVFSNLWAKDVKETLNINDCRIINADYGDLPKLVHDPERDLVITWNATSTGVAYQDGYWISNNRKGLVIADATAAAFCLKMPFEKLDVICFSWQKGLGGEAAHGMIALSPRALQQLHNYKPSWPIPRLISLWKDQNVNLSVFEGYTINTPSMLAISDVENALDWVESLGGVEQLYEKAKINTKFFYNWVEQTPGILPMVNWSIQSKGGPVCFLIEGFESHEQYKNFAAKIESAGLAFDIAGHAFSKPSLRVWCGPTVELDDLKTLTKTLEEFIAKLK